MHRIARHAAILLLLVMPMTARAADRPAGEAAAVCATVEAFFDAMSAHDAEAMAALLVAGGVAAAVRASGGTGEEAGGGLRLIPLAELPRIFAGNRNAIRERIWDAEIRVDDSIATLWAPYDFHLDGAFDHCGFDAFQLLKRDGRWRIVSIVWTSREQDCPPGATQLPDQ
ncbi:MAG: nuclear transport factor 2 family protein [Rhodothalassiaceae bacterium]